MIAEIAAGLSSLKAATDIAKGLNAANTQASINEVKLALHEKIFEAREALTSAQESQTAALERIRELEKEVAQLKAWSTEKERYELMDLYRGFFAYVPKIGEERGEPAHALCATCYERGVKSYLQTNGSGNVHMRAWECPSCKTSVKNQWNDMAALIKKSREVQASGSA